MANVICNPFFEDGLLNWSYSRGVEVVDADIGGGAHQRLAQVPAGGFLAQDLANEHPVGDLRFTWYSLGSDEPAVDVVVSYADGTQARAEFRSESFGSGSMIGRELDLEGHRGVMSMRLDNVGSQPWGVSNFSIRADSVSRTCLRAFRPAAQAALPMSWVIALIRYLIETSQPPQPQNLRALLSSDFRFDESDARLASQLFSIDTKLDRLLELLMREQRTQAGKRPPK